MITQNQDFNGHYSMYANHSTEELAIGKASILTNSWVRGILGERDPGFLESKQKQRSKAFVTRDQTILDRREE